MKTKPKTKPKTKTNGVSSPLHFSLHFFLCFFLCFLLCPGQERPEDHLTGKEITVFCFHDVRDDVHEHYDPDLTALGTTQLIRYFAWLKGNGYHPVSIDQLVAAGKGKTQLPGKPVLLTFDDGLKSIYTHIYPALKLFNFPAVVALVGAWIEGGDDLVIKYGSKLLQADDFLTWDQVRELDRTGLIEFASHSFDLHRDLPANPQGSRQPLATARLYDLAAGEYESDEVYEKRVRADLEKSIALMKKQLGKAPRAIAWPYGKYNRASAEIAASLGLEINLTLAPKINRAEEFADGLNGRPIYMSRWLISQNPVMEDFTWQLNWEVTHPLTDADPMRFVQVDLDYLYDPDPEQLERNLGALLERIRKMDIGVVFLQAFADPDGDGTASALYFPNRHLPVRADIFNRVCWQLKIRSNVKVFAWMPVMAFAPPPGSPLGLVTAAGSEQNEFKRLSIFDPAARKFILEIYEDLGKHADFDGIHFHDDAFLSDFEDASPAALAYYSKQWKLPAGIENIRSDPGSFYTWSHRKADYLVDFTKELWKRTEKYCAPLLTSRNLYARVIMEKDSYQWFAQSHKLFLGAYDYTAIMAMPYMEKARDPMKWLIRLVREARKADPGLKHTLFELQSKNWNTGAPIPAALMVRQMELLQLEGALNFGYYPDDFIKNQPDLAEIRMGMSLQSYPYD